MHSHPQPHTTATSAGTFAPQRHADTHAHTETHAHTHRSVAEHRQAVRELLVPLAAGRGQRLPLVQALGRGLAEPVTAPLSLPPFANSQMDGFAIRSADVPDAGRELRVVAPVPAGASPAALQPDTAAPIMTGAMVPAGADAVVPVERAVPAAFPAPGEETTVWLPPAAAGTFIRSAGSDIEEGERALAPELSWGPGNWGCSPRWDWRTSWSTVR